ncbi:hypothetical protein [Alkaliflexus imshenetskii]|uniref:hypothetical protein n=1 Tax=Alkaliflexus imshenetskii TaxID=286730 RepID=UPI0012F904C1|nr:hypothetical protein [Alkaliflexus imshenetskii]
MHQCGRVIMPRQGKSTVESVTTESLVASPEVDGSKLKSYDEIIQQRGISTRGRGSSLLTLVIFLAGLIYAIRFIYLKGWFSLILPQWVSFKTKLFRDKATGSLRIRITICNNTSESRTFKQPEIYFRKGSKVRTFRINNEFFPLTLMPGISHALVVDVGQFYDKVGDLKGYNRVSAGIEQVNGKTYKTFAWPQWLVFK